MADFRFIEHVTQSNITACIVNGTNEIIGKGCNSITENNNNNYSLTVAQQEWGHKERVFSECHAVMNVILDASQKQSLKGCTLYVHTFPCKECTKLIVKFGIKKVFYISENVENITFSKDLLREQQIKVIRVQPRSVQNNVLCVDSDSN